MYSELLRVSSSNAAADASGLLERFRRQQASVRKFGTEKAAQRYLDDNAKFFAKIAFQIEHIQNGGDAI